MIAHTPSPPYFAVIFTSVRTEVEEGYTAMADRMLKLAAEQEGFVGVESARNDVGITISYWRDLESIQKWKAHAEHQIAQQKGKSDWYKSYKTRIARVERDYGFGEA
ncbi:hypothetical protein ACA910_019499 [Epithemia clementina (nom. ined.)]